MSDWIKHDGKGMPVPPDTPVIVRFRDGEEEEELDVKPAKYWFDDEFPSNWDGFGDVDDIIAYRIIHPTPSQAMDELIEASAEELDIPSSQANREREEQ